MKANRKRRRPSGRLWAARALAVEVRSLPILREVARVARESMPPEAKLEGALEILFGAYGDSDAEFSKLLLSGWMRAPKDKRYRLTMAWLREQLRLSLEEILDVGVETGSFRADLDTAAVAAVMVGAAEGCLLQAQSHGGSVAPAALVRALLRLAVSAA